MRTKTRSLKVEVICRMPPAKVQVTAGKDDAVYVVHRIGADWGRAFKVCRLNSKGEEIPDRSYDVNLDGPDHCHCWDYLTTGDCKHVASAWAVCKGDDAPVTIKCKVVGRTQKGLQIETEGGELVWLPKYLTKIEEGGVVIPEKIAREKGLI